MRHALRDKVKDPAGGPLVSIIVASYNYEQYIGQTIQSVLSQTYPNWELIISDDCSTDNSLEIIRSFRDDRITLLTNETNTGGRHVSEAYAIAKGKYLCSLDSDDFVAPDKIEKQVRFLEHQPKVDVLGTFIVEVDAEGNASGDKNGHEDWFNQDIDLNQLQSWVWQNRLAHSSVMIRKSLQDKIGSLNHDLFITADYDYWARCVIQKAVFQVLPEKLTYYRYHGGNVTHRDPERLFLECAYIFCSILSPYLIEVGRADLIIDSILELPAHTLGVELDRAIKSHLLSGLIRAQRTIDFPRFLETLREHPKTEESLASAIVDKFVSTSQKQSEWVRKLEEAKSGLEQQRVKWQTEAERGAQLLKEQSERIRELEKAKSWLVDERAKWQTEAERGTKLLEEQSERIRELEKAKSGLAEQLANKTQAMEELQESSRMLAEAKDYSLSQIESKDRIIEAANIELASRNRELALKDEELNRIKYSKLQRLKDSILRDPLSFRKLLRITYLVTTLATPKYLRQRLKPLEQKAKQFFNAAPDDSNRVVPQKPWNPGQPLVSIVIPCFNYGKYVEEAIDSVLAQTFQNFEIIVVDAGSTDGTTISTLRSLRKPKTKIYFRKGRHLVGDNRNFGIAKARGKYICCLDADDKLKPTYLEKALFLLETRHYDLVSTSLEIFGDKEEVWHVPKVPTLEGILEWNQFTTIAVFRKVFWEKAGGYHDTGLGKDYVYEDWDFWVRLMALGARATNITEPLMLYRSVGNTSLSKNPEMKSMEEHAQAIAAHNQKHLQPAAFQYSRERNLQFDVNGGGYADLLDERRSKKDRTGVLFALPFVITGGADTILLQTAKHLSAHGFDISVVTTLKTDASFGDNTAKYQAITQDIYHLYDFLDEGTWKEFILYLIEAKAIDIIFVVGCAVVYDILPEIKQKFPHVKIIDQLFNEFGHIENNRKHASLIDLNVLASESLKNILIDQYGEAPEKTRVIVHGVEVEEEFNPENIDTSHVLATGQVPRDKLIVSFIGRFSTEKRPEMFVDIANALRGLDQLYFVMIGHGPDYHRVKQQIRDLDLEDRIYAPGIVDDIKPFLKLTDVLVIPSRIEGIPIVLMEALALGVPVVASDVGGIPSVLTDNETGFVCDRERINDFIQCIERLCTDASLRAKLKQNARTHASKHLSLHQMTREYHKVFSGLSPQKLRRKGAVGGI